MPNQKHLARWTVKAAARPGKIWRLPAGSSSSHHLSGSGPPASASRHSMSALDCNGRTIFVADAHRSDGKRFVVRADEKLTAFLELEAPIRRTAAPRRGIFRRKQENH